jgi:hypothetical protein
MPRFTATILRGAIASLEFLLSAAALHVQHKPAETDKPHAISTISERERPCVDNREIAGAVTLVATPDRIVHLDATEGPTSAQTSRCAQIPSSGSPR